MGTSQLTLGAATPSPRPRQKNAPRAARPTSGSRRHVARRLVNFLLPVFWVAPVAVTLVWGWEYYLTPVAERAYSDLHDLFKPSGTIGLGLGYVGTLFTALGVGMYSLRKRIRLLGRLGELGIWLQLHIYLCTLGPVLILFHTSFKFGGIISIGFWCMAVVGLTGFFGRYFYAHIPGAIYGQFQSLESLRAEQAELIETIKADFGEPGEEIGRVLNTGPRRPSRGFLDAMWLILCHAWSKRRRLRKIKKILVQERPRSRRRAAAQRSDERPVYLRETLIGLVRSQVRLEQKIVFLEPFRTVFNFWHIMHIPLTIVMSVIVAAHIALGILLGYTWIF